MAQKPSDAALLDQEVDQLVLQRVAWPENSPPMFCLLRDRPEFAGAKRVCGLLDCEGGT